MKVKIIKANKETYWYSDKIGQTFDVIPQKLLDLVALKIYTKDHNVYKVEGKLQWIDIDDCEDVKDMPQEMVEIISNDGRIFKNGYIVGFKGNKQLEEYEGEVIELISSGIVRVRWYKPALVHHKKPPERMEGTEHLRIISGP